MVKILDCTTRDGGYKDNWEYSDEYISSHIEFLNANGVKYYEIGYRNYLETEGKGRFYRCMPDVTKPFVELEKDLLIGVMTDVKRYNPDDFVRQSDDTIDFVSIAAHPDKVQNALEIAGDLFDKGYKVFVQLMDVTNIDADGYLYLYMWDRKNILESLYFADSYSVLKPSEIAQYYNKFKILGYKNISFHAHNNQKYALENSLAAINLGAYSVDVTRDGVGRNGGNLDISQLFENLK